MSDAAGALPPGRREPRHGHEPHGGEPAHCHCAGPPDEVEAGDFPAQPSQKDGLGRMCKPHWNQYTSALRKAALARKAAEGGAAEPEPDGTPERIRTRAPRGRKTVLPEAGSQGDAG